jgi:poly(beta-D-mannuronate) lyase
LRTWLLAAAAVATVVAAPAYAERYFVRDQAQFRQVDGSLKAGDEVVLANGEWRDFRILLEGQGEAGRPIVLRGETPGGVILTGQSNLRLSGEHLVVSDLVFRDGHSPTDDLMVAVDH